MVGGGARISGAGDEAMQLAEFLQAPLMGTQDSKGVVPESSPFYVGTNYASVGPADVVFPRFRCTACDRHEAALQGVARRRICPEIIHIDIDPDEIGRNLPTELGIVADAKTASAQLLEPSPRSLYSRGHRTPKGLPVSGPTSLPG